VARFFERRRRVQFARSSAGDGGGTARRRPRLADDLGRGRARPRRLAWLTISGEDAPDLVATAPIAARAILRAKVEAVLGIIALVFAPLVVVLAAASLWHALVTGIAIVITAAAATAIQLWFRSQAKRSQFRRRQVSSRVATFAEAFSSIGWAGAAAVAAVSLPLAVIPALLALAVLGSARALSPRRQANA
jgi:ABC-2 type transport system permease protein